MKFLQNFTLFIFIFSSHIFCHTKYELMGFGSPIVDGVFKCESDLDLCDKMNRDLSYHMSGNFPVEFYDKILYASKPLQLGGSAMNTIRATNYILKLFGNYHENKVAFFGSIAQDSNGHFIKNQLNKEGISHYFEELADPKERTSTCIVLIKNLERVLLSDLGSSQKVSKTNFEKYSKEIKSAKFFYSDSYLIGFGFKIFQYVFQILSQESDNTLFTLNLSSDNIIKDYFEKLILILPYADIIFFNEQELNMLKTKFKVDIDDINFLHFFSNQLEKKNKSGRRVFINTRGEKETYINIHNYHNNSTQFKTVPIFQVDVSLIEDFNGAGDSFAGGVIAGYLLGYSIEESVRLGSLLASEIIKLKGFQLPENLDKSVFNIKRLNEECSAHSDL
jgi:adenosine kinase